VRVRDAREPERREAAYEEDTEQDRVLPCHGESLLNEDVTPRVSSVGKIGLPAGNTTSALNGVVAGEGNAKTRASRRA
jgi:hypothetical protein